MDGGKSCGGNVTRKHGMPSVTEELLARGSSKTRSTLDEEGRVMQQPVHGDGLAVGVAAAKGRGGSGEEIERAEGRRVVAWLIRSTSVAAG